VENPTKDHCLGVLHIGRAISIIYPATSDLLSLLFIHPSAQVYESGSSIL